MIIIMIMVDRDDINVNTIIIFIVIIVVVVITRMYYHQAVILVIVVCHYYNNHHLIVTTMHYHYFWHHNDYHFYHCRHYYSHYHYILLLPLPYSYLICIMMCIKHYIRIKFIEVCYFLILLCSYHILIFYSLLSYLNYQTNPMQFIVFHIYKSYAVYSAHIYREDNCCADRLTNLGFHQFGLQWWDSLPSSIHEPFFMDRVGLYSSHRFCWLLGFGLIFVIGFTFCFLF